MLPKRLAANRKRLQALDPASHSAPYVNKTWSRYFAGDADYEALAAAYPDAISRGQLEALSRATLLDGVPVRRLFLAAMLWGFGKVGYGPYRTRRMLDDPAAPTVLPAIVEDVREGRIGDAYERCRLPFCGPSFFSKFIYFVGLGCNASPLPVILDSVVAASLRRLATDGEFDATMLVRGKPNLARYPDGYLRYIELLDQWSRSLGCRADAIELFLFDPPAGFWQERSEWLPS